MINTDVKIILASASPRRRQILGEIISDFSVCPSTAGEELEEWISPRQAVQELAVRKAESVYAAHGEALVIGADTVVEYMGRRLGKPLSKGDAESTLKMLRGKEHSVYTGVCVIYNGKKQSAVCRSGVEFNNLSDEFIREYVDSGSPLDKAGSYGIQDGGIVKKYTGSYTNIVGLPKELLEEMLNKALGNQQFK